MFGGYPYAGGAYGGGLAEDIPVQTDTILAVEWSPTTGALEEPVWVDIAGDVRSWSTSRGRGRELERFQPGRATIVLDNRTRAYDSATNADVRPMRRVRIRETINGVTYPVFDGYVDKWQLDYPDAGKDATATIIATDGFKIFARTELPRSVWAGEVENDSPDLWWHLDEDLGKFREGFALNSGATGTTRDGTFVADPVVGQETIVVNDPGASMKTVTVTDLGAPVPPIPPKTGVFLSNAALDIVSSTTFTVEAWQRLDFGGVSDAIQWLVAIGASNDTHAVCQYQDPAGDLTAGQYQFLVVASGGLVYGVETPEGSVLQGEIHHVVCVVETGGQMAIWLDGTRYTAIVAGATGTSLSGITRKTGGALSVAYDSRAANSGNRNWHGQTQEFAVYLTDLDEARIADHYAAGSAPWQDDQPGERIDRVVDLTGWTAGTELDAGNVALQSAAITGQTSLEHVQKVGETEFGLVFISRDGTLRFVGRENLFGREPDPAVLGDDTGEVGYTNIEFDDGDAVIRNSATISRLNGAAQTVSDTDSVGEFGRFQYSLEGLLHRLDSYSLGYANLIVDEYSQPRRRVTSVDLGPPIVGEETVTYEMMLGRELGDAVTVRNRPLGGGDMFEQVCAIEGIEHAGSPKVRTARFILSPELRFREVEDAVQIGYAQVTANQTGIASPTDLTGLSVTVTVGSNRRIKVTGYGNSDNDTAGVQNAIYIMESTTVLSQGLFRTGAANIRESLAPAIVLTPSAGSHTYKLRGDRSGGTMRLTATSTEPAFILVEDIGPA